MNNNLHLGIALIVAATVSSTYCMQVDEMDDSLNAQALQSHSGPEISRSESTSCYDLRVPQETVYDQLVIIFHEVNTKLNLLSDNKQDHAELQKDYLKELEKYRQFVTYLLQVHPDKRDFDSLSFASNYKKTVSLFISKYKAHRAELERDGLMFLTWSYVLQEMKHPQTPALPQSLPNPPSLKRVLSQDGYEI